MVGCTHLRAFCFLAYNMLTKVQVAFREGKSAIVWCNIVRINQGEGMCLGSSMAYSSHNGQGRKKMNCTFSK